MTQTRVRSRSRRPSLPASALLLAAALGGLAAPLQAQGFGKNKIQYQDFDWHIYRSPHFDVYYYSEEEHLLQKVVSFAESAYDHLSRRFDYQIKESTPLIFYRNHAEFEQNNIILGFIPEGVGAFATDIRFRMVLPVDMTDAELYQLLLHELTHIFQYHVLFGGKVSRGFTTQPPTWLIEGMASYYAQDESTSDKMFLRDAVVNDLVPPITQARGGGFFAYRFGHAVFDFMEERWGPEGVLDFLFEYRSTLGSQVDRALQRAFRIEAEDFDADFRRWLREKYLPQLVATGEPSYFGRRFLERDGPPAQYFSPVASPSGDLIAALSTERGRLDVVLLDSEKRRPLRNLTKGWSTDYQYLTAQFATSVRRMGTDLAFSPDGNFIAVFGRREEGRSLLLVDVIHGGIARLYAIDVQQPFAPTFSPDGGSVAFAGTYEGQFDLFRLDLADNTVSKITNDAPFDGGPAFSPDGSTIVYSSEVGAYAKLFRFTLADATREQLTDGAWNDQDPAFTRDGSRLYFTSDRDGFDNIYSLDLASGAVMQHTNAVTGCFMPAPFDRADGTRGLVYSGYWRGRFDLYRGEAEPIDPQLAAANELSRQEPEPLDALEPFEPDIQVAIDEEKKERYRGFKLFLEDGDAGVGVTSDQLVVSQTYLSFSDYLGDRRVFVYFSSVSTFSDFDIAYVDLSDRLQWGVQVFDDRAFYLGLEQIDEDTFEIRGRGRRLFRQTGVRGFLSYPLDFYRRVEGSLGYIWRDYDFTTFVFDPQTATLLPRVVPRSDNYPELSLAAVGDTTVYASWGPVSGRRWRVGGSYAPNISGDSGENSSITSSANVDVRQYVPLTRRMNVAFRLFGAASWGEFPNIFYFGGLDTVRGFEFRELVGDRAFFTNLELRFPLVDQLWFPFLRFQGIRGRLFLDVGGAWFDYAGQDFELWDSENDKLADPEDPNVLGPVSAYGWGFTIRFIGVDLNWDFAKRWDF
ncbi:MAG TPA: BamA/TamA family outer membrane protein, partial [Thermoanaerobaculia bacterium]|nr:BamA/TamA family outer membrane protein [Thermoanaerobaculia bacterium]